MKIFDLLDNQELRTIAYVVFLIGVLNLMYLGVYKLAEREVMYSSVIDQAENCRNQIIGGSQLMASCEIKLGDLISPNYRNNTLVGLGAFNVR